MPEHGAEYFAHLCRHLGGRLARPTGQEEQRVGRRLARQ